MRRELDRFDELAVDDDLLPIDFLDDDHKFLSPKSFMKKTFAQSWLKAAPSSFPANFHLPAEAQTAYRHRLFPRLQWAAAHTMPGERWSCCGFLPPLENCRVRPAGFRSCVTLRYVSSAPWRPSTQLDRESHL